MRVFVASVATTAILMMARPALAQAPLPPEPKGIAVTPFIGVGFGGDLANAPVAFGAALGYGLNTRWTVEGEISFMPDATQGELIEFDTSLWSLSANVLYDFTAQRVTPYVTAGLGVMSANADLEGTGLVADDTFLSRLSGKLWKRAVELQSNQACSRALLLAASDERLAGAATDACLGY
jgi:opacity protein-like surface antigen